MVRTILRKYPWQKYLSWVTGPECPVQRPKLLRLKLLKAVVLACCVHFHIVLCLPSCITSHVFLCSHSTPLSVQNLSLLIILLSIQPLLCTLCPIWSDAYRAYDSNWKPPTPILGAKLVWYFSEKFWPNVMYMFLLGVIHHRQQKFRTDNLENAFWGIFLEWKITQDQNCISQCVLNKGSIHNLC